MGHEGEVQVREVVAVGLQYLQGTRGGLGPQQLPYKNARRQSVGNNSSSNN